MVSDEEIAAVGLQSTVVHHDSTRIAAQYVELPACEFRTENWPPANTDPKPGTAIGAPLHGVEAIAVAPVNESSPARDRSAEHSTVVAASRPLVHISHRLGLGRTHVGEKNSLARRQFALKGGGVFLEL